MSLQSDGQIVVGGSSYNPDNSSNDFVVARYNTDGSLDTSFDGIGYVYTNFEDNDDGYGGTVGSNDYANALFIQSDQRIVAIGHLYGPSYQSEVAMARYGAGDTELNVTVIAINDAPIAVNDSVSTNENVDVTIDVLANDSDEEDDGIVVTGVTDPDNAKLSRHYISKLESGKRNPSLEVLMRLAKGLKVTLGELVGFE